MSDCKLCDAGIPLDRNGDHLASGVGSADPERNRCANAPLTCEDCGEAKPDVKDTGCPYARSIHGTDVPAILCPGCYQLRCDEI